MFYDYKAEETTQDVVASYEDILDDICDEFFNLRRDEAVAIYCPGTLGKFIFAELLELLPGTWVSEDSENGLLQTEEDVRIILVSDGLMFVDDARDEYGDLVSSEAAINYVYDSYKMSEVRKLGEDCVNILVFGFDDEDNDEEPCNKCEECWMCDNKPSEISTKDYKNDGEYFVNGKSVSKDEFELKEKEFLKQYCEMMDDFNQKLAALNEVDRIIHNAFRLF